MRMLAMSRQNKSTTMQTEAVISSHDQIFYFQYHLKILSTLVTVSFLFPPIFMHFSHSTSKPRPAFFFFAFPLLCKHKWKYKNRGGSDHEARYSRSFDSKVKISQYSCYSDNLSVHLVAVAILLPAIEEESDPVTVVGAEELFTSLMLTEVGRAGPLTLVWAVQDGVEESEPSLSQSQMSTSQLPGVSPVTVCSAM